MTECTGQRRRGRSQCGVSPRGQITQARLCVNNQIACALSNTHPMSTSTTKARHYAALGGRIRALNSTMAETDALMSELSDHLLHMQQFAACHAAQ